MNNQRLDERSNVALPGAGVELAARLGRLHELLQTQLALVRQGRLAAAVGLFEETDQCVRHLARTRGLDASGATEQWQDVERLYRELSLVLAAQRTEVSAALDAAQRGRTLLKAYRRPLSSS